jgi:hypothetical protein
MSTNGLIIESTDAEEIPAYPKKIIRTEASQTKPASSGSEKEAKVRYQIPIDAKNSAVTIRYDDAEYRVREIQKRLAKLLED